MPCWASGGGSGSLSATTQLFFQHYEDEYDFLFIFIDHDVANAQAAAAFRPVFWGEQPGTGNQNPIGDRAEYGSERLLGVVGAVARGADSSAMFDNRMTQPGAFGASVACVALGS